MFAFQSVGAWKQVLSFNMKAVFLKGDVAKTLYCVCMPTSGHSTICDGHETNDSPVLVKPAVKQ